MERPSFCTVNLNPAFGNDVLVLFKYGFGQTDILVLQSVVGVQFYGLAYDEFGFSVRADNVYMGRLVVSGVDVELESEKSQYFWLGSNGFCSYCKDR